MDRGGRGPAVFILSDHLYAAGADNNGNYAKTMESLNISDADSEWQSEKTQLPFTTHYSRAVVVQDRAYIFGGSLSTSAQKKVISWTPGESEWRSHRDMKIARNVHCLVTDGEDTVWILGGCQKNACWETGFIEQYTVSSNTHEQLIATPDMRSYYYERVNFCVYAKPFISITFPSYPNNFQTYRVDSRFHVFDTVKREWMVSSTRLQTTASHIIASIAP